MYFYYEVPIAPNTLDATPIVQRVNLSKGFLDFVDIGIPRRVQRLAKVRIFYNEFMIVPFNRDGWLTGEDITLRVPIELNINDAPYQLVFACINLDDTFQHTLSFGISLSINKQVPNSDIGALQQLVQVQG